MADQSSSQDLRPSSLAWFEESDGVIDFRECQKWQSALSVFSLKYWISPLSSLFFTKFRRLHPKCTFAGKPLYICHTNNTHLRRFRTSRFRSRRDALLAKCIPHCTCRSRCILPDLLHTAVLSPLRYNPTTFLTIFPFLPPVTPTIISLFAFLRNTLCVTR